ncbi:carbon storage regulator [Blastopirellula marina]|uniref:Translational regulator CsrA n=1 Tax=Blastopirellula marina TaxID=124 RepID=A0A2S8EZX3_9BACT|nr:MULTISPECIES: carbon storage regulator [Pirellulaceae]PQO25468.1 carbon storage regulator [Blastopirellula marina]RCS42432.1 carbon storage regulator [Bremerella cremea]
MLVLSRRVGEKIEIGNGITVTVLRVTGKSVRIGIEAPECVSIRRSEITLDHQWPTPPAIPASDSEMFNSSETEKSV